ncbi:hypothetical protein M0R45_027189 [Rubus argutus]|uniref:Uncharacterized protein n=1 Tax=Rubus argutus TaxID=59490 RepID=A0AAW1X3D4_RUBAR
MDSLVHRKRIRYGDLNVDESETEQMEDQPINSQPNKIHMKPAPSYANALKSASSSHFYATEDNFEVGEDEYQDNCPNVHHNKEKEGLKVTEAQNVAHNDKGETSGHAQQEVIMSESLAAETDDTKVNKGMGPWMLMNYKNRRNASTTDGTKGKVVGGSRFSILADDEEDKKETANLGSTPTSPSTPNIVKLWNSFQEKMTTAKDHVDLKAKRGSAMKSKQVVTGNKSKNFSPGSSRQPMCDVSNNVEALNHSPNSSITLSRKGNKVIQKNQRKQKHVQETNATHFNTIQELISCNNNSPPGGLNVDATFGRCPPEELMGINTTMEEIEKVNSKTSSDDPPCMTLITEVIGDLFEDINESNPVEMGGDVDMTC